MDIMNEKENERSVLPLGRRSSEMTPHPISHLQQEFSQVRSILARNTSTQSDFCRSKEEKAFPGLAWSIIIIYLPTLKMNQQKTGDGDPEGAEPSPAGLVHASSSLYLALAACALATVSSGGVEARSTLFG